MLSQMEFQSSDASEKGDEDGPAQDLGLKKKKKPYSACSRYKNRSMVPMSLNNINLNVLD